MKYHFTREEFRCKGKNCDGKGNNCGFDTIDFELLDMLEDGRAYFTKKYGRVKVEITGGDRCIIHNEDVQKQYNPSYVPFSSETQHLLAKGADHKHYYWKDNDWVQIPPREVYDYYDKKYPNTLGLGLYRNRVHMDSRKKKARWGKT